MAGRSTYPLLDILLGLSRALDLVAPQLLDHHKRVAVIARRIAEALHYSPGEQQEVFLASLVHDLGALSLHERIRFLEFEAHFETREEGGHPEIGFHLLRDFPEFAEIAPLVLYHHVWWNSGRGVEFRGQPVPRGSHIIHLADRVAVLLPQGSGGPADGAPIRERIRAQGGNMFSPQLVEAFLEISSREGFFYDLSGPSLDQTLFYLGYRTPPKTELAGVAALARLLCRIIDFRSSYTATHAHGVSAVASALASLDGFGSHDAQRMAAAGYLHDLGKIAIPMEILNKPGPLTPEEYNLLRKHPALTFEILEPMSAMCDIREWASYHHERMDGRGYPFQRSAAGLPRGSRIMAVADVLAALSEDRPYRRGLTPQEGRETLQSLAVCGSLDPLLVETVGRHYGEILAARTSAQILAAEEYREFRSRVGKALAS